MTDFNNFEVMATLNYHYQPKKTENFGVTTLRDIQSEYDSLFISSPKDTLSAQPINT